MKTKLMLAVAFSRETKLLLLGRNYVMTGQYTDFFFPEHGVRYVAVNDSYDSAKDDNDIAPFKNILNEMYAKDISKKVRSVRQMSAKQGKFMGSKPPFGYVKSPEDKTPAGDRPASRRGRQTAFPRVRGRRQRAQHRRQAQY